MTLSIKDTDIYIYIYIYIYICVCVCIDRQIEREISEIVCIYKL